jgi:hypothetical protein
MRLTDTQRARLQDELDNGKTVWVCEGYTNVPKHENVKWYKADQMIRV